MIKNKIYIDKEGEGWVCDCIDPLSLTRLRYPNFNWIGGIDDARIEFTETEIDYTSDFWDKQGLKQIKEYWKEMGKKAKILHFAHDKKVRN